MLTAASVTELKVKNNKVMCHLSMKLSDMFDPNPMHTSDKIVVKHISVKETLLTHSLIFHHFAFLQPGLPRLLGSCIVVSTELIFWVRPKFCPFGHDHWTDFFAERSTLIAGKAAISVLLPAS